MKASENRCPLVSESGHLRVPSERMFSLFLMRGPFFSFRAMRSVEHEGIRLRSLRMADIPLISRGLRDEGIVGSRVAPRTSSRLAVWWWLRKTYTFMFSIEVKAACVGFIGLYNFYPHESAEITLVLFDGSNRRRGYGSRAYRALITSLEPYFLLTELIARVEADNLPSLSFWKKLGFRDVGSSNGIKTMAKSLLRSDPQATS